MRHFNNLLYISHGSADETEGLKQALSLARNNQAPLKVLVVCPSFPKDLLSHQEQYDKGLLQQTEGLIHASKEVIKLEEGSVDVSIELAHDQTPSTRIIQEVLRHGHDLVIKEADMHEKGSGFKALDMDLLRKCPVPVWLCQPISHSRGQMNVAVAIDPQSVEPAAETLNTRLLEIGRSLADSCSGELHIISCWDYEFESYLRGNMWMKISDEELNQKIGEAEQGHLAGLQETIARAGISGAQAIHHPHGQPEALIPAFVNEQAIDILVMGTVARTGISGFMIGNTAENILQQLTCSLIALKPPGFISPVKAY